MVRMTDEDEDRDDDGGTFAQYTGQSSNDNFITPLSSPNLRSPTNREKSMPNSCD